MRYIFDYMIELIKKLSSDVFDEVVEIRRYLHMNPELSFEEFETSRYIKNTLNSWGIKFSDNYSNNGLSVVIEGKHPNSRVVALRADFDALPIYEENDISYKSKNEGVMHACGHDAHTACLLGALKILYKTKEKWNGTIKFIFQPAEERIPGGAKQMIKDGVLKNPNVDNVIAQHVLPELEVGKVGFRCGTYMASTDEIYVSIVGHGGHAAIPEKYNNPIIASSKLILDFNQFFEQKEDSIFAIGYVKADGSTNVIPDEVNLMGTFRSLSEDFRRRSHIDMKQIMKKVSEKYDVKIDLEIRNGYPALNNDDELTKKIIFKAKEYMGEKNVIDLPIRMTGEDFSYFANEIPSCFYRLGTGNTSKGLIHGLHTSKFNIDENALRIGTGLMAYLAVSY